MLQRKQKSLGKEVRESTSVMLIIRPGDHGNHLRLQVCKILMKLGFARVQMLQGTSQEISSVV